MEQDTDVGTVKAAIGQRIKTLRRGVGLSQNEMAAGLTEAGYPMDASNFGRLERGVRNVGLAEAQVIAKLLGARIEDLLPNGDDDPSALVRDLLEAVDRAEGAQDRLRLSLESLPRRAALVEGLGPDMQPAIEAIQDATAHNNQTAEDLDVAGSRLHQALLTIVHPVPRVR